MNDRQTSDDFDERFLSAYGLGDPDNPLKSSSSASITNNRESKLEKQAKQSPWSVKLMVAVYVYVFVWVYVCVVCLCSKFTYSTGISLSTMNLSSKWD